MVAYSWYLFHDWSQFYKTFTLSFNKNVCLSEDPLLRFNEEILIGKTLIWSSISQSTSKPIFKFVSTRGAQILCNILYPYIDWCFMKNESNLKIYLQRVHNHSYILCGWIHMIHLTLHFPLKLFDSVAAQKFQLWGKKGTY